MQQRILTVGYQHRESKGYGGSGIGTLSRDLPTRPMLRISNDYLQRAGFTMGSKVIVRYEIGRIIVTLKDNN